MGTRSITTVYEGETPILSLYRQFDGYPSGHGQDLHDFLSGKVLVNGFSGEDSGVNQFNGAGDLAARLVCYMKNHQANGIGHDKIGGFYLQAPDPQNQEDYQYDIITGPAPDFGQEPAEPRVRVKCYGEFLAEGTASEFLKLAQEAEAAHEDE